MLRPVKVGVLTVSDGRDYIHEDLLPVTRRYQEQIVAALQKEGFEVVAGNEIVWNAESARRESRRLAAETVDLTIFNYAIWA